MSPLPSKPAKSPILAAVAISLAIGIGALVGSAEPGMVEEVVTGRFLTRPFTEAQQDHTFAIAALETNAGHVTGEIDFLAKRVRASIRRNEEQTVDRFTAIDAELAALKDKIAGIQDARAPRTDAPLANAGEMMGLRSSLHDLASAHSSAVTALTRRLDKIEVTLGLSTDMMSSAGPAARKAARRVAVAKARKQSGQTESEAMVSPAKPEHGHLFNLKPISQQSAPLRLSGLRG
jgi:hypothetical protein